MKVHNFTTTKTARYASLGTLSQQTEQLWFVCHGYGQLAPYFIRSFSELANEKHFVVAPEALSRFYLNGFAGRVGATWMTKEERLSDITDYINYLNSLYEHIMAQAPKQRIKINVLGFSQGAATVCRWLSDGKAPFDQLVLWAGMFPPDLPLEISSKVFAGKSIKMVYGLQDSFIKEEAINQQKLTLQQQQLYYDIITFEGEHTIDAKTLQQLAATTY